LIGKFVLNHVGNGVVTSRDLSLLMNSLLWFENLIYIYIIE
jgi:hypothetical protein